MVCGCLFVWTVHWDCTMLTRTIIYRTLILNRTSARCSVSASFLSTFPSQPANTLNSTRPSLLWSTLLKSHMATLSCGHWSKNSLAYTFFRLRFLFSILDTWSPRHQLLKSPTRIELSTVLFWTLMYGNFLTVTLFSYFKEMTSGRETFLPVL